MKILSGLGLAALLAASSTASVAVADEWTPRPEPRRVYRAPVYKDMERPAPRVEYREPRRYHAYRHHRPRAYHGYPMAQPAYHRAPCSSGYQDHVSCGNGYQGIQMRAYQPAPVYYQAAPSYSPVASYGAAHAHYAYPSAGYSYGYATSTLSSPFYNAPLYNRPCLC